MTNCLQLQLKMNVALPRVFESACSSWKGLNYCIQKSRFQYYSQKRKPNLSYSDSPTSVSTKLFTLKEEKRNIKRETWNDRDGKLKTYLSSNKHDPDSFGTLSEDWKTQEELKKFPEEEDDVVVTEYLDSKEGKMRLTVNQYGRIIKRFLEQKKVAQAIEVLETRMLKYDRVKPDNYIFNLLIGACGKVGYTKKAFNLYKQMRDRDLKATGHTYTGLFNSCANSPYPENALMRAHQLRVTLVEKAFLMNQTLYHAMIKAFGRCGDIETAFVLVDEMLEKKIMVTDETFNFLLQACITDKEAGFRQALLVWRKMLEKRVRPSLFSFNLLLRCSRDCGMGDEATAAQVVQVLLLADQKPTNKSKMITSGENSEGQLTATNNSHNVPNLIAPKPTMGDVMIVNSITSPEHRLMLMGGSAGFLDLMEMFRVHPDIKTFTQLLDQIPSTLSAEIYLVDRIKQAKVVLDSDFCNMLMRKRALRRDYESAKEVLKLMQSENLKPNLLTFGVLAMSCQDLTSARQLIADIDKLGFGINIEILGTLVKNACHRRDCEFIIYIMNTVKELNIRLNKQFLSHLENFYRFASSVLRKQLTDDTGVLNSEGFDEFCDLYRVWRKEMKPEEPPEPWEQFTNKNFEPEDQELIKHGKIKYS